jgi:hypothetical protein
VSTKREEGMGKMRGMGEKVERWRQWQMWVVMGWDIELGDS